MSLTLNQPKSITEQRPYAARGGAALMWACRDREILMDGPAGTGKTRAILEKAHFCLMKYAGCRVLAVRKTRASMTESVLVTYEEKVLPTTSPIKAGQKRSHRQSYDYPNGSTFVIGGMDNPDRIMSTEFDLIVCFEWTEGTEDDHEKLTTRLRNGVMPYQQLIADCNPSYPSHWLNQRALRGTITRILSRHEDNPTVTPAYLATLEALTGARKLRLRNGIWAAQEGMVYDEWDAQIHLLSPFPIPSDWARFRSFDFGFTNPFVCQWWAIDNDGRMYLYREWYMSGMVVQEHAKKVLALSAQERFFGDVADPEDADGRATLAQHRIATAAATKTIKPGIEAVKERLKVQPDGKPRLFMLRDALVERDDSMVQKKLPWCTEQEIEGYIWAKGSDGKNAKEEPIKANDHGMDALRYAVMFANQGRRGGGIFR